MRWKEGLSLILPVKRCALDILAHISRLWITGASNFNGPLKAVLYFCSFDILRWVGSEPTIRRSSVWTRRWWRTIRAWRCSTNRERGIYTSARSVSRTAAVICAKSTRPKWKSSSDALKVILHFLIQIWSNHRQPFEWVVKCQETDRKSNVNQKKLSS